MIATETPRLICTFGLFAMLLGGAIHSAYVEASGGPHVLTLEWLIQSTFPNAMMAPKYGGTFTTLAECGAKGQGWAGDSSRSVRAYHCTRLDPSKPPAAHPRLQ